MNVTGDPTIEYPHLKLCLYLNGLGDLYLDGGKKEVVGWYVEESKVFLTRTVDGVPKADEIFAYAYKDDTSRLVVDLMPVSVRYEQEGEEYLDVTWPEFDAEDAKYFIGTWEAVTYINEGLEISAELADPMTIVLKDDGTALSIEGEEEPYELRWYSDYSVAYIDENPTELVEIIFDGNGNISVKMDAETTVIMKPVAEVIETGTILGAWESSDRTVDITEDGRLKLIYKEDGYTNHMQWEIVDGIPTVTLGTWKDSTIEFVGGYLIINYSVHQKLTRVGKVPEIYVGSGGFVVPEDDASTAFGGNWVEADGSVELFMGGRFVETLGWTRGKVTVVGAENNGFCVDYYGTYYNFGITGDGLMLDYFGTPRFYEPEMKEEVATPAVPEAAAPVPAAASGLDAYMNQKYVEKNLHRRRLYRRRFHAGCGICPDP